MKKRHKEEKEEKKSSSRRKGKVRKEGDLQKRDEEKENACRP